MNAFERVGQPSSLGDSLRRDSKLMTTHMKKELAYARQNGKVRFGLNPARLFSQKLPAAPNGEYRK